MTVLKKGYKDDIGIDLCLDYDVVFRPFETKTICTELKLPSKSGVAIMMCSRSSAAKKGIIVNQCPIDPGYTGFVHIIVHNTSNSTVHFPAGTAFAQCYAFKIEDIDVSIEIKNDSHRGVKNFGSSDRGEK